MKLYDDILKELNLTSGRGRGNLHIRCFTIVKPVQSTHTHAHTHKTNIVTQADLRREDDF